MLNFGLIGAGGYVALRHMQAIKSTSNALLLAMDPNDSVGIIDSYFPEAYFCKELELFDIQSSRLAKSGTPIDYVSICSPNYLHDSHIRFALRSGSNVICEKPVVLDLESIDELLQIEKDCSKKVNTILQLRLHQSVLDLKNEIDKSARKKHEIEVTYLTSRGNWYDSSWKADESKSGGVATNIGVHFFDMLKFIFGEMEENVVHHRDDRTNAGYIEFEKARVKWFLSIDKEYIPRDLQKHGVRTYRSVTVDGKEFEFSDGFADLHKDSYQRAIDGEGFGLEDCRTAIEIVSEIRSKEITLDKGYVHPIIIDNVSTTSFGKSLAA